MYEVREGFHLGFRHDPRPVCIRRAFAHKQFTGDEFTAKTIGEQLENLDLQRLQRDSFMNDNNV
jgi:hypothetical protein